MEEFLTGMIAMAFWVAGLFFLRFWRDTRDRLFLIFAIAFWLSGAARFGLIITGEMDEPSTGAWLHSARLAAYLLILFAIADKNGYFRRQRAKERDRIGG